MVAIGDGSVRVYNKTDAVLPQLRETTPRRVPVWAAEATDIPPGFVGHVNVTTYEDYDGLVYVEASHRQWKEPLYTIGRCVVQPHGGVLMVSNRSGFPLEFKERQILIRAHQCQEELDTDASVSSLVSEVQYDAILEKDVNIGTQVPLNISRQLIKLINEFRDCFAQNLPELGKTTLTEMTIDLSDVRPYRLSYSEREVVREMIDELKENGIVRDSRSPFASPILLVRKKNG